MKISLYLSVLLLVLVIQNATANVRLQRSPQQYCGSKLADMMRVVCNGNYNGPSGQKRSQIDSDVWDYKDFEEYNAIDYPYLPKREATSFMPSRMLRSLFKRNIVDECCNRPCYLSDLRAYCGSQ